MGNEWREFALGEVAYIATERIDVETIERSDYVSTDNMLPNFGGILPPKSFPTAGKITRFYSGDTLFSNIRTYFKKIARPRFDGGCSNDVLVFRSRNQSKLAPEYLYQLCRWEEFINLSVRTAKGVKMPRGDKTALLGNV